ncbi:TKL/TKL-CCIN protein kinase, variant [Allomyces macrogynus ATCC 38327]|uniref:TKL/TKL-CCIN protein kinase, variant n=1 Tax=Allomyces macrogynus (strain ATCC 38327) TaxID=578462 RepID=A0A0L0T3Q0_ALLM3|nr:TKL/TKL-CCIN protein kinase, variant [Allomyces macrogynus ATCC 38327]|eukprot:KNE69367.1 TKL/TKL-CCIN protein kinase, variant [Allomyces macrogynus ATCC 38327]
MPSISTNSSYVVSSTSSNRATAAAVQDGDQLRPVATQSPDALPLRPLLTRLKVEAEQPVHAAHQNLLNFVARMAGTVYETLQDQFASTGRSELWDQLYKILIRVDAAMTVGDAITQLVRLEMDNAVLFNAVRQLARLASAIKKLSWATDLGQQLPAVGEKKIDVQAEPMADVEEEIWTEAAKDFDVQLKQLRDLDALTDDDLAAALRLRPSDRLEALAAVGKVLQKPSIAAVSKHLPRAVGAQVIVLDAQLRQTARRIQVTLEQAVPAADRAASSARTTQLDHLAVTAHEFIVDQEPFARGGFAELYRATWIARNSDEVVMKRLLPSAVLGKTMRDDLAKEARAWAAVHHEHVLPLLGVCLAANAPFLITPYMPYGTLVEYAETRPKEHTRLLLEVSLGMAHIHRCGIAHGDLKGNNVLVDVDGVAKVTDFGLARFAADASRTTLRNNQGPVRWLAPERLEPGNKRVYEPDVYAFAMLCYEVVAGRAPFYEQPSDIVVLSWIQRGDRPTAPMAAASYSPALWGIVAQCWAQNPAVRPSFCAVAGMLHPLVPGAPPLAADVAARCVAETAAKHEQREKELCAVIELLEKRLNDANARSAQVEVLKERVRDADARVAQVENKARQDEEKRSAAIDQLEKRTRDADALARRESERATAAAERARDAEARAAQAESRARRESERADMAVAAADRMRTEIATERSCRADSDRAAAQARQECERERSARVTAENEVERLRRQLRDIPSPSPSPSPGYGFGFGPAFMSFDMGGQGGGGGGGGRRVMHCSICGMAGTNASTHPHHGRR